MECSICKKPAVVEALITQENNKAAVFLCEDCLFRVAHKIKVSIIKSITPKVKEGMTLDPASVDLLTLSKEVESLKHEILDLTKEKEKLEQEVHDIKRDVNAQDFLLYRPMYKCTTLDEYKEKLMCCRQRQIEMVQNDTVAHRQVIWHINGDVDEADSLIDKTILLCLSSFNIECEYLISKVRYNNIDKIESRINHSFDKLNEYLATFSVYLVQAYKDLKIEEMKIYYEYILKKKELQDYAKEQREIQKENARVQQEIEEERNRIEKEQIHYRNRLSQLQHQIECESNNYVIEDIKNRINAVTIELEELEKALSEVNYREANQRAGYVYVISNIGAFGEGIYKIGMTRRLNPLDRIDELSNASVPFKFDVHAMIFSDDAPRLESLLHNRFSNRRVNMVNNRKEFFRVSLSEIEQAIKENYDSTAEFEYDADAEQFRETLKIIEGTFSV